MRYRLGLSGVALVLLVPLVPLTPAVAASKPMLPSQDPFYRYAGWKPLSRVAPGTVLKQRSVALAFGAGSSTPVTAVQLLYRTTGQLGQPTVTVTTLLEPTPVRVVPRIIDYLSFYDGLAPQCDPSYTLAGGDPHDSVYEREAEEEQLLIMWYLSQGDIVTVPDFEGTNLDWMAGREAGYGSLDAIRATESYLHLGPTTRAGLSGYSGGAMAGDWASELAPAYAPSLNLVGVAEGGIPANYFDMFSYINGTTEFSAAIPAMLLGVSRAYGVDVGRYLSAYGRKVVRQEAGGCMASFYGRYPGLTIDKIMLPPYRDLARVEPFSTMLREQTMGNAATHPAEPLLMGVGDMDGRGDGVMSARVAEALARHYCREGVPVDFQTYRGASHVSAGIFYDPQTGPFLQARFAGAPPVNNCSSLGS